MNQVILSGRLTREPEVRYTTGNNQMAVAKYSLAVERFGSKKDGEANADFINCIAFAKSAEFAEKYLHKGMKIIVNGRIQTGSYTNKEGRKVYTTDVVVSSHEFCESRAQQEANQFGGSQTQNKLDDFMSVDLSEDGELPFT